VLVPASTPLSVRVGEQLVLRAPAGVIHAEAADPSVASVTMPSPDVIVVLGIRPADTELLLVNSATVLAQPLHVTPALVLASTLAGAPSPAGFVDLTYVPQTQAFWADIHRPGVDATVSSSAWQYHVLSGTLTVIGSSGLQTPL
jgi:Pilus formation protein N terminal region